MSRVMYKIVFFCANTGAKVSERVTDMDGVALFTASRRRVGDEIKFLNTDLDVGCFGTRFNIQIYKI